MAKPTVENGINKFINVRNLVTTLIVVILGFSATNLLAVRKNTDKIKLQDKEICEYQTELKKLQVDKAKIQTEIAILKTKQQTIIDNTIEIKETLKLLNEKIK